MIRLFMKLFVPDYKNTSSPKVRQSYGMLSGAVGIALNILLFAGKFLAGILSGSIAITADAFNNLSDAGSSLITLFGFKLAGQKPDRSHPFGHGRMEYLSGFIVAMIIFFMAFELLKASVSKIITPSPTVFDPLVAGILVVSIGVKFYMFFYNRWISRLIDSAATMATARDSLSDALSTTVVLFAVFMGQFSTLQIDGWCGVAVALFILYSGYKAAKDTINPLLGQAPDGDFVRQIEHIILSHPDIIGIHDLIVHNYGPGRIMISVHAEVPADGDILALHDSIDNIEHELKNSLFCEAVIHMDPVCTQDEETIHLKQMVSEFVREISPSLSLHDFRLVKGQTHTNIIFDLLIPYDFPSSDRIVCDQLTRKIEGLEGRYYAVIEIDKNYV